MKTVITYGTFDLLHVGHINLLRRAKDLGDKLIVMLSTDNFCEEKGKMPVYSFEERKQILESVKYVDHVFAEDNWTQKINDILRLKADVFVMGSDWENKFDYLKLYCEVKYLPRTENISTTTTIYDIKNTKKGQRNGRTDTGSNEESI